MTTTLLDRNDPKVIDAARRILAYHGTSDPHPALLADTVNEVAHRGIDAALASLDAYEKPTAPAAAIMPPSERRYGHRVVGGVEWYVVKDTYEIACDHYACAQIHRRLFNASYDKPTLVDIYNLAGEYIATRHERRFHTIHRTYWAVIRDGETYDTAESKRAAMVILDYATRG